MMKPAKTHRTLRSRASGLAQLTLVGATVLILAGLIAAGAWSVSQRYAEPEDALAKYAQPSARKPDWHESEQEPIVFSDFKVTQRIELADMNAVQLIFTWRQDREWDCSASLIMGESQDLFGGWHELRYSHGGCSSGSPGGGSAGLDFWQSAPWQLQRYYYFVYVGASLDEGAIEFVFTDGKSAKAWPVDDSVGLAVRRGAPFQIEAMRYYDAEGDLLYEAPGY